MSGRFTTLLYHNVGPPRPGISPWMTVAPASFRHQLRWLRKYGYRCLSADDIVAWATHGRPIPTRSVLLTFDDGYVDLADTVFPALRNAGLPAIVFIVTQHIGDVNTWDEHFGNGCERLLDADTIRHWSANGITFGAHTRTHPQLTTLSREAATAEISGSRADLEDLLQTPVHTFAYPYGDGDAVTRRLTADAFPVAFSVEEGVNRPTTDPHWIRRTMVYPTDTTVDLALRLRFGYSSKQRARYWAAKTRDRVLRQINVRRP